MTDTITPNVQTVRAGYDAFARGDMAALSDLFAPDAAWTHRNGGRFSGAKRGFDAITAFFGESVQLSAGTLRVEPTDFLGEGDKVAVLVHMSGPAPTAASSTTARCTCSTCATATRSPSTSTSATRPLSRRSGPELGDIRQLAVSATAN